MRAAPALAAALALLAGCGPSEGFGRLGPFKLQSGVLSFSNQADAVLRYETSSRGCQALASDFSATVDGTAVLVDAGGRAYDSPSGTELCNPPRFVIPRPRTFGGVMSVEARSGDDVLTAQVEGLGMQIQGTPLLSPGAIPRLGETIQIKLEPGWDQLTWPDTGLIGTDFSARATSWPTAVTPPVDGVLGVTIPATLPIVIGTTNLALQVWARHTPSFTNCDAPLGCAIGSDVTGVVVVLKLSLAVQP